MNYVPTPIEDLDPETQKVAVKAQGLREQNANMAGQIEQMGAGIDVAAARQEHLLNQLVSLGVITEHAMWEINLDWEQSLRPQLKSILDRLGKAQSAAAQAAARPKLIIPGR